MAVCLGGPPRAFVAVAVEEAVESSAINRDVRGVNDPNGPGGFTARCRVFCAIFLEIWVMKFGNGWERIASKWPWLVIGAFGLRMPEVYISRSLKLILIEDMML